MRRSLLAVALLALSLGTPNQATTEHSRPVSQRAAVHFPISCTSEASELFDHAVVRLHSFSNEQAETEFQTVIERDPACAMAYWGIAMSLWNELGNYPVVPTDDGARATLADPAVPATVARSTENGFLPAALAVTPHRAGHVSVYGARPLESSRDVRPDSRFPVLPSAAKTISSTPSLRCLHAPDRKAWNKTPARCCLRA